MKKYIAFSIMLSICCLWGFTQKIKESDVPAAVKASFGKLFPGNSAKWEKEDGNYEAGFKKEGKTMSATFQTDGTFMESETAIKESELPPSVINYLQANYTNKKIKESAKITNATGVITYEAEVDKKDLIFDSNGKFLKEVKN
jgi:Putative beta-lactamase-inhibitor-like, PepSY-like